MKHLFAILLIGGLLCNPALAQKPDKGQKHTSQSNAQGHDPHAGGLPPGLQKKAERGQPLPPGWEKKLRKGVVIDAEIYSHRQPVAAHIAATLPPLPTGVIQVRIENRIVRLVKANLKIHDVIEMRF